MINHTKSNEEKRKEKKERMNEYKKSKPRRIIKHESNSLTTHYPSHKNNTFDT